MPVGIILSLARTLRCSDPEYYNSLYGIIGTVFQSLILLAGVLGNMMVVITVRGTKSLHTTTNCYLVSLALADLITLLSSVPQEVNINNKTKSFRLCLSSCEVSTVSLES